MHKLSAKIKNARDLVLPEYHDGYLRGILLHSTQSCKGNQQNDGFSPYHPDNFGAFSQYMKVQQINSMGDLLRCPDEAYQRMLVESYTSMIIADFNSQIQDIKFNSNTCNDYSPSQMARADMNML